MAKKQIKVVGIGSRLPHFGRFKKLNDGDDNREFHYHAFSADPERIRYAQEILGYEIVKEDSDKKSLFAPESTDSVRRIGKMVVGRCPLDEWKARQHEKNLIAMRRMDAPREAFRRAAESVGLEAIDTSKRDAGSIQEALASDERMSSLMRKGRLSVAENQGISCEDA